MSITPVLPMSYSPSCSTRSTSVNTRDEPSISRPAFGTTKKDTSQEALAKASQEKPGLKTITTAPSTSYSPTYSTVTNSVSTSVEPSSKRLSFSCSIAPQSSQTRIAQTATDLFINAIATLLESTQKYSANTDLTKIMREELSKQLDIVTSQAQVAAKAIDTIHILEQAPFWVSCGTAFHSLQDILEPLRKHIAACEGGGLFKTLSQIDFLFNKSGELPNEREITALFNSVIQRRLFCSKVSESENVVRKILPFVDSI